MGAIVLLVVTLALGGEVKGAARWLRLGGFWTPAVGICQVSR